MHHFSFTSKETNLFNDSEREMPISKTNRIVTFHLLTSNACVKGEPAFSRIPFSYSFSPLFAF